MHPLNATPTCPYCSNVVLRQMRHHHLSWFCRHCWTEVPNAMVGWENRGDRPGWMRRSPRPQSYPSQTTRCLTPAP